FSPGCTVAISAGPIGAADAPLASDSDNPAAPKTGRALLRRFRFGVCFIFDMIWPPITFGRIFDQSIEWVPLSYATATAFASIASRLELIYGVRAGTVE